MAFSSFFTSRDRVPHLPVEQIGTAELAQLRSDQELIAVWSDKAGVGLWDAVLIIEDALHPESKWTWSGEFHRLLGFSDKREFPNLVTSWSDRLHPEDIAPTFAAFGASLRPGAGGYDVAYRLKMRNGDYRWFRATGGVSRLNGTVRACGSLVDIHEQKMAELNQAKAIADQNHMIATLREGLVRLAAGDLAHEIDQAFAGDLDHLRDAFNQTVKKFGSVIGGLRETSRALKTATSEILSGTNDLSERTTRQAATIEETSAAMEQLAATITDNAKRADEASAQARVVSNAAESSGEVMHQANQAMERITTSSSKISNIIGLIDDIAFQTNLLALNASVEAARAGEAGKGFAVVAIEVRRLAQSAAQASQEVKALIDQSANEVRTGTQLVAGAADKLSSMLNGIRESDTLLEGIAQASREQAAAIEEVRTSVRQLDEMTQHNAALVEETNAAIEQTEGQAGDLDAIVDVFVIETNSRSGAHGSNRATQARARQRAA